MGTRREAIKELRVSPAFTEKDLKAAYRKRSLETHPDKGGSSEKFMLVAEAYSILSGSEGKFGGDSGSSGQKRETFTSEEEMRAAEDMFFEMFDEFFDKKAAHVLIDELFKDRKQTWGLRLSKSIMKKVAGGIIGSLTKLMESEGATVSVNGNEFSGADFKKWREEMKKKRAEKDKTHKQESINNE